MGPIKKIQYNCRKATLLIEKKLISGLSISEKVELHIHLAGCLVCRVFENQSGIINKMVRQMFTDVDVSNVRLDDDFKQDLQHRIEDELNKS
ncbi:hypothetical protein [Mucilaginibacter panaciglaebae]|uniref:Zinc finger protein n=1 Tax=Mucilaginibacter panaciglaebae TaxID=502331 RepID=A0ABP7WY94_9SPHI